MYAVQIDTTDKPYSLFVGRHMVGTSSNVRSTLDIALKTWKRPESAQRWIDSRQMSNRASVIEVA